MFCYITGISFFGELIALTSVLYYHTNLAVYNVIGICNLVLICLYFNKAIPVFAEYQIGKVLSVASVIVWLLSVYSLDSMHNSDTPYMFFEGGLTLGMTGFSMEHLLVKKSRSGIRLRSSPHFWFAWILFAYWCISISQWLLYRYFEDLVQTHTWFSSMLLAVTVLVNLGFLMVFFWYPKMKHQDAS